MTFYTKFKDKLKSVSEKKIQEAVDMLKEQTTPPEIQKFRIDTCLSCDKLYKPTTSCRVCGCFMRVKTWLPYESCPLGKWKAINTEESHPSDSSKSS